MVLYLLRREAMLLLAGLRRRSDRALADTEAIERRSFLPISRLVLVRYIRRSVPTACVDQALPPLFLDAFLLLALAITEPP